MPSHPNAPRKGVVVIAAVSGDFNALLRRVDARDCLPVRLINQDEPGKMQMRADQCLDGANVVNAHACVCMYQCKRLLLL